MLTENFNSYPAVRPARYSILVELTVHVHVVTFAGRICTIVGDLLVLFVTWHKTYAPYRSQKGVLKGPSITRVMLYNGTCLYFTITMAHHLGITIGREHILHVGIQDLRLVALRLY